MLSRILPAISSSLDIGNKTAIAAAPMIAVGAFYVGAAAAVITLRAASVATEFFGKEELSDKIEEKRAAFVSFLRKTFQYQVLGTLAATALTTSMVLAHNYVAKGYLAQGKIECPIFTIFNNNNTSTTTNVVP